MASFPSNSVKAWRRFSFLDCLFMHPTCNNSTIIQFIVHYYAYNNENKAATRCRQVASVNDVFSLEKSGQLFSDRKRLSQNDTDFRPIDNPSMQFTQRTLYVGYYKGVLGEGGLSLPAPLEVKKLY